MEVDTTDVSPFSEDPQPSTSTAPAAMRDPVTVPRPDSGATPQCDLDTAPLPAPGKPSPPTPVTKTCPRRKTRTTYSSSPSSKHSRPVSFNDPGPSKALPIYNVNKGPVLPSKLRIVKVLSESVVFKNPEKPAEGLHLAEELMKLTGTVMTNRVGLTPGIKAAGKKIKKGDIHSYRKQSTPVVSWKDKMPVHMFSTKHKGISSHMTYEGKILTFENTQSTEKRGTVIVKHGKKGECQLAALSLFYCASLSCSQDFSFCCSFMLATRSATILHDFCLFVATSQLHCLPCA
ncbi:hypothetical protein J6590_096292 [Homalodisca vitripennis]|nr:hypothetical protein J6590_096292 [Homalodisca vitripennis]